MKHFPSIKHCSEPMPSCYAFIKYDGSNIRSEWSKKQGWYKFGSRWQLLGDPKLTPAIELFKNKYGDDLHKVFTTSKLFRNVDRVVVYSEWFGAKSFAGQHVDDDPKDIVLFDVNPMKKGFIGPKEFLDEFGHLKIAELVYQGDMTDEFINDVRTDKVVYKSKYEIATEVPEGLICKGGQGHKLWMCKIKHQSYLQELKRRIPVGWEKFV